ncbi:MAG: ABC-type transport auxiliary lipoprotein family protein [Deltaproteobacteria bacterium]|jgi:ABC-type uncharacterized transport system auxiliary subunit|nr:ABC-type transport auxiliary lipoprotein family protein [Deltaproteobacteria bacterium]
MTKNTTAHAPGPAALRTVLAAALGTALLAGCGISRPYPLVRTFTLDRPEALEARAEPKASRASLIVTASPPPGAYEGRKLVYLRQNRELVADFYSELSAPPARAVADGIAKLLEFSEPTILVSRAQGAGGPDWSLDISLLDMYGDLTTEPMTARLAITATLSDLRRMNPRPAFARDYVKGVPAPQGADETRAEALVRAYSEAVREIVEELRPELRGILLGRR